ncbi:MAG: PIN domain-containing protein [Chloroflexi bacterium]|nr:PIN domain-containing protein [Chloroflexota bacterium]
MLIALLDANVLWSAAVRDTLLLAAELGLFLPVLSRQILEEMARSLKLRRPDLDPARIDRTVELMLRHFPEALVDDHEDLSPAMTNDEGNRHVLAAAVRGGAEVIVTWNVSHFPPAARNPYGIDLQTPDGFLENLWLGHPDEMALVLQRQAQHLINPSKTPRQVLETLKRSVPRFAEAALRSGPL